MQEMEVCGASEGLSQNEEVAYFQSLQSLWVCDRGCEEEAAALVGLAQERGQETLHWLDRPSRPTVLCPVNDKPVVAQLAEHLTVESVQLSDGPWFDSGRPDFPSLWGMKTETVRQPRKWCGTIHM